MRKLLLILLVAALLPATVAAESEAPEVFVFRAGVVLGMTKDEVIRCEGDLAYEPYMDTGLMYSAQETPWGEADICYIFEGEGLRAILLSFTAKYESSADALAAFQVTDASLTEQYGDPDKLLEYSYYDEVHYQVDSSWQTDLVYIYHNALGDDSSLQNDLLYFGLPY